jgi:hypothetical protein
MNEGCFPLSAFVSSPSAYRQTSVTRDRMHDLPVLAFSEVKDGVADFRLLGRSGQIHPNRNVSEFAGLDT